MTEAAPPISAEQTRAIEAAEARVKRWKLADTLAGLNGGTLIVIAIVAALSGIFDPKSLLAVPICALLAFIELRGRARLRRYEPSALKLLAGNQLALVIVVTLYAALQMHSASTAQSPIAAMLGDSADLAAELGENVDLGQMESEFGELYTSAVYAFYGLVIALTVLFQGGCALYYWTRQKHLAAFLAETPKWVLEWLQKRAR
jgi:hypothetical protein